MKDKVIRYGTMGSYLLLYVIVAIVSLISSIHFFNLAHQGWMSTVLACSFEIGQMACLFGALTRKKKGFDIVWIMFVALTLFQCMANTYAAYVGLGDYQSWSELFGLVDMEPMEQKRIIAGISGAILPLIALGFVKCLTDYLNEEDKKDEDEPISETISEPIGVSDDVAVDVENIEEDIDDEKDEEDVDDMETEDVDEHTDYEESDASENPNEFEGIVMSDEEIKKLENYGKSGLYTDRVDMQKALDELKGYKK